MKFKYLIICFTIFIICLPLSACQDSKVPAPVTAASPTIPLASPSKTAPVTAITSTLANTVTPTSTPTLIPSPTSTPAPIVISKDNWEQVEIVKIIGDGDAINVAPSRDKKIFAVGFHYAIRVFDRNTWEEITRISSLTKLSNVTISPDGSALVAGTFGGEDTAIVIWDINTGRELKRISIQGIDIRFVTYSPDGTIFAVSGFGGTQLYDPKDWSVIRKVMWAGGGSLEFSMDNNLLLINNGFVEIWDLTKENEKPIQEIRNTIPAPGKLIFDESTQLLLVQYSKGIAGLRNPITSGKLRNWEIEPCANAPIGQMPPTMEIADGLLAITCEQDLYVWDIASGEKVWSQSYPATDAIWLSAGPDSSSISVFQYKNNVTRVDFINIETQEEIHSLAFQGIDPSIRFQQNLLMQALASQGKVHLPTSLEEIKNIFSSKVPEGFYIPPIYAVSQDGALAAAYISGINLPAYHMSVIRMADRQEIFSLDGASCGNNPDPNCNSITALAFNEDGSFLSAAFHKNQKTIVKIWNLAGGVLINEIDLTDQFISMNKLSTYNLDYFAIRTLHFTPDGLLIVIADDGRMHFVDSRSGEWLGAASSNLDSADQIIPLNNGSSFAVATSFGSTSGFNYFPEFTGVIPIWGIEASSISP